MNPFRYSIWLVPCAEQRAELARLIESLATRFGTPPFMPHATLCSGVWKKSEPELTDGVDRLRFALPVEMKTDGIDWIERWFGFFFLRLRCETDLFERAARVVEGSHSPEIGPHLSLLYSFGTDGVDRETLRAELAGKLPSVIRFDALELVRPATGRWEDISSWEIFRTVRLR